MGNLFERASSGWARYDDYEWKEGADGILYLTPTAKAKSSIYDPMKDAETLVVDALNVGRKCMGESADDLEVRESILQFALRYGLLGMMAALPTTPDFMDYEAVYLPKNHFIKEEAMRTEDYLSLFFPFEKPNIRKRGVESMWNVGGDRTMIALAMTMSGKPMAVNMEFQREYAERYDWLKILFTDWAFTLAGSIIYYEDYDRMDEDTRILYRQGMAAFSGIAPTYHVALLDRPTIIWDFHSLLLVIQMMFSFMLADDAKPLRLCRHCAKAFVAGRPSAVFCSPHCKNRHNVYKSRAKNKGG